MAFGILEDKYLKHVPGTILLSELGIIDGKEVVVDAASQLKRGKGRNAHVILNPQPADNPADPLNWPRWKKEACFWTLAFAASLDGALSPMTGPGYVLLAGQFDTSVDDVASSFGAILIGLGCFMFIQGSFAVKFGHRIVYLCSVFLMFIACIWCALSPNLVSIRASRVFQGFGMSSLQSLVASTIEQIYFVHERGARSIIWSFSIMAGITMGPFIFGYVVQNLSWQMGFWFVSIPLGICTLLVFFFVPETTYFRPSVATGTDSLIRKDITPGKEEECASPVSGISGSGLKSEKNQELYAETESAQHSGVLGTRAPTYVSQLKIWHGTFSTEPLWKLVLRPIPFALSPVTMFLFLAHGMQTVWLSLLPICSSTIFTLEYNFNAAQIGLTNLGGLVGIILAMLFTSTLTDRSVIALARYNGGVYEPEFRLLFVFSMLFGVFGYAGWAGTTHNMPWIGAVACLAMANFSIVISGAAAVTYLLDTHGPNALHCLAVSNFLKNMVLYGFSFFANGMIAARGVKTSLLILAGCQAVCWFASVPMYIFGKRARALISRHPEIFTIPDGN